MFGIGEPVCHSVHGVGVLRALDEWTCAGRVVHFAVVGFEGMTVMVNQLRTEGVLRLPVSLAQSGEILERLGLPVVELPLERFRFLRLQQERLKSGDLYQVCDVVRELTARSHVRKLTPQVGELLKEARRLLVDELALVREEGLEEMATVVDDHLRMAEPEPAPPAPAPAGPAGLSESAR